MEKIKRTFNGIKNMPAKARDILIHTLRICSALLLTAIILRICAADAPGITVFRLLEASDCFQRFSPGILVVGVIFSLTQAAKEMR